MNFPGSIYSISRRLHIVYYVIPAKDIESLHASVPAQELNRPFEFGLSKGNLRVIYVYNACMSLESINYQIDDVNLTVSYLQIRCVRAPDKMRKILLHYFLTKSYI